MLYLLLLVFTLLYQLTIVFTAPPLKAYHKAGPTWDPLGLGLLFGDPSDDFR